MEIRDPVHGSIHIKPEEAPIITHAFFQRLRGIKQLGFSEFVFPGATHTRFLHSVGVFEVAGKAFDRLFGKMIGQHIEFERLRSTFKLACLLHDIGHAPLSHSTESVMPQLSTLKLPKEIASLKDTTRQASHEDYTLKAIADSSFSETFNQVAHKWGVNRFRIADLIRGETNDAAYFIIAGVNYFPILHQLVSSELDCDRMDYLLRDSYFCGVSYGQYDLDWLLDNLAICLVESKAYLGINERSVVTFDDFLLSRYHMFVMVYFHYRSVCLEQILFRYFETQKNEYVIPSNIEEYIEHDDHYLLKILKASKSPYADAILKNQIPEKIYESFNIKQLAILEKLQTYLETEKIEFIRCNSLGRLSKYYPLPENEKKYPLKVIRKPNYGSKVEHFNIDQATDLFDKFSQSHAVNRIHCEMSKLSIAQKNEISKIVNS